MLFTKYHFPTRFVTKNKLQNQKQPCESICNLKLMVNIFTTRDTFRVTISYRITNTYNTEDI